MPLFQDNFTALENVCHEETRTIDNEKVDQSKEVKKFLRRNFDIVKIFFTVFIGPESDNWLLMSLREVCKQNM